MAEEQIQFQCQCQQQPVIRGIKLHHIEQLFERLGSEREDVLGGSGPSSAGLMSIASDQHF